MGGAAVACDVTVANHLKVPTGVGSSTVTVRACHGAAHAALTCTTSTTPSDQLTTAVTQCNGSYNGGGATVTCTVHIVNTITGGATPSTATTSVLASTGAPATRQGLLAVVLLAVGVLR